MCYPIKEIERISNYCKTKNIPLHLDGARLFNALVKTGVKANHIGPLFDSISLCFSKGLGTPVGSVLIGSKDFIQKARRVRKVIGGGMRQVGMLAAAGIYALENNIDRLSKDHYHAELLANALSNCSWIEKVMNVETNIVVGYINESYQAGEFIEKLKNDGILPLSNPKKILVTGPNADNHRIMGDWTFKQPDANVQTVYQGFEKVFDTSNVDFINSGESLLYPDDKKLEETIAKAEGYDAIIVVVGSNSLRYQRKEK